MAKNKIFGLTSRLLMSIVAGCLILSYLSMLVNPAKVWMMSLVGLLFVPLSALNIILLIWAIKRLSKSFVIPLLALMPAFFFVGRYVRVDTEDERAERMAAEGRRITVVSYNVGRFGLQDKRAGIDNRSECADSVFSFLKSQDADIICLQEFHAPDAHKVKAYIDRHMKGYHAEYYMFPTKNGAFGNVTLSRMPVKNKGKIKFDESANLAIYTDCEFHGRTFRVYNCHFESYVNDFSSSYGLGGLVLGTDNATIPQFYLTGNSFEMTCARIGGNDVTHVTSSNGQYMPEFANTFAEVAE